MQRFSINSVEDAINYAPKVITEDNDLNNPNIYKSLIAAAIYRKLRNADQTAKVIWAENQDSFPDEENALIVISCDDVIYGVNGTTSDDRYNEWFSKFVKVNFARDDRGNKIVFIKRSTPLVNLIISAIFSFYIGERWQLDEVDIALQRAIYEDNLAEIQRIVEKDFIFQEISENKERNTILRILKKRKADAVKQLDDIKKSTMLEIDKLNDKFNDLTEALDRIGMQIEDEKRKEENVNSVVDEIYQYINSVPQASIKTRENAIVVTFNTELTNFDVRAFSACRMRILETINSRVLGIDDREKFTKFLENTFSASPKYKIQTVSAYQIEERTVHCVTLNQDDYSDKILNPHISYLHCLGGYASILNKTGTYDSMPTLFATLLESAKSINVAEVHPTFSRLITEIWKNRNKKALVDKDGNKFSVQEVLEQFK